MTYAFLHLTQEVQSVCEDFLRFHHLSYFQYRRVYSDGTFSGLASQAEFALDCLEGPYKEPAYRLGPHPRQSQFFFWNDVFSSNEKLLAEKHSLFHGITLIRRHKDFYDVFGFAMLEERPYFQSYYLDETNDFLTFSDMFPQKAASLIKLVDQERITLPAHRKNAYQTELYLPHKSERFEIMGKTGKTYITSCENFCLQLLREGKSYREAGSILSISPRTVETYLMRLKERTGYSAAELKAGARIFSPVNEFGFMPGRPDNCNLRSSHKPTFADHRAIEACSQNRE